MAASFPTARSLPRADQPLGYLNRRDARYVPSTGRQAVNLPVLGIALLCLVCGAAVVVAELDALFVGLALIVCVLVLVDFRVGVILLILLMPASYSQIFPRSIGGITGLNPVNLLLVGTFGSYLLHAIYHRTLGSFIPRSLLWLYIVPLLIAGAMGSRHVGKIAMYFYLVEKVHFIDVLGYVRDMVVKPLFMVLFALLLGAAVARSKDPGKFFAPMLISIWLMSLMVIVYFVLSGSSLAQIASTDNREFLTLLGMHANQLGRLYVIAYALLLFTWVETRDHGAKMILLATIGIVMVALILTFSRGSFLGVVLVTALFLAARRDIGGLLFGALLATAVLFVLPQEVYDRAMLGFGQGADAISAGRITTIWIPIIPDILKSPIWGSGAGSMLWSEAVRTGRAALVTHPHNAYLQILMDMGIIGLILVSAYLFQVWRGFRRLAAAEDLTPELRGFFRGAAAGLLAFLAAAFADGSLMPRPEQFFLWFAIGLMYGVGARKNSAPA